jgi:hypothetical protein
MPTFSPTSALVSVVFPALGRPTSAMKPLRCGVCSGLLTGSVSHRPPTSPPRSSSVVHPSEVLQNSRSRRNTPGAGRDGTKSAECLRFLWGVLLDDPLGVLRPGTSTLMTWDMPRDADVDTAAVASYVRSALATRDHFLANAEEISAESRERARRR